MDKQIITYPISIGKIANLMSLPVHTIRFWTESFSHIECIIKNGRRYYDEKSHKEMIIVYNLLKIHGFKIENLKNMVKYNTLANVSIVNGNSQKNNIEIKINDIDNIIDKIDNLLLCLKKD